MTRLKLRKKIISFILLLATLFSILPLNVIALEETDSAKPPVSSVGEEENICHCGGVSLLYHGAQHRLIDLPEDKMEELSLFVMGDPAESIK